MSHWRKTKTEHAGAKNGGGSWGRRAWVKWVSRRLRRAKDRECRREWDGEVEQQRWLEFELSDW